MQKQEEEPRLPPGTPFPDSSLANRLRKSIQLELGPLSILVYTVTFINALVLCLNRADAEESTTVVLSQVGSIVEPMAHHLVRLMPIYTVEHAFVHVPNPMNRSTIGGYPTNISGGFVARG